jgi:DNA-binding transcriptional ArsR family regulator
MAPTKRKARISIEKLEKAAYILKTISHPTRLAVIELLTEEGEMSVNSICGELEVEQSLLSHHLLNMKAKGLLGCRKDGTTMFYSLREKNLTQIIECVEKCECNM